FMFLSFSFAGFQPLANLCAIGTVLGIGIGTVSGTVFNIAPSTKTGNRFFGFFRRFVAFAKILPFHL
ncbi:MAG: hypothetical protein PUE63_10540, partial [Lachnospiraceae bacterium]|nr:hypothetical protein [Lachnospiraceae bacterium]